MDSEVELFGFPAAGSVVFRDSGVWVPAMNSRERGLALNEGSASKGPWV